MAYIAHVVTGVWCGDVGICDASACTVWSGIVVNPSAGAITDHRQSAKDIDPYFKFQLYVEVSGHRKPVLIYRMGRINPESERTAQIKFPPWVGFQPTNS